MCLEAFERVAHNIRSLRAVNAEPQLYNRRRGSSTLSLSRSLAYLPRILLLIYTRFPLLIYLYLVSPCWFTSFPLAYLPLYTCTSASGSGTRYNLALPHKLTLPPSQVVPPLPHKPTCVHLVVVCPSSIPLRLLSPVSNKWPRHQNVLIFLSNGRSCHISDANVIENIYYRAGPIYSVIACISKHRSKCITPERSQSPSPGHQLPSDKRFDRTVFMPALVRHQWSGTVLVGEGCVGEWWVRGQCPGQFQRRTSPDFEVIQVGGMIFDAIPDHVISVSSEAVKWEVLKRDEQNHQLDIRGPMTLFDSSPKPLFHSLFEQKMAKKPEHGHARWKNVCRMRTRCWPRSS